MFASDVARWPNFTCSSASSAQWAKVSRVADKALALLLPDKGPRSMESLCVVETAKFLGEDFHRQRCEVKARRDAKVCCKILTALGRRDDGKTWNNVPLELRKDIDRIHRNLGHASGDLLESCFVMQMCHMMQFRLSNIFGAMPVIV